jgi:DnaJ-class molecular chaperone
VKKFKVRRQKYNAQTGIVTTEERIFEVPINRGLKPGSKIKFESGGDQTPEGTKELHFKLSEVSP